MVRTLIRKGILLFSACMVLVLVFLDFQRAGETVFVSPALFFDKEKAHEVSFKVPADQVQDSHTMVLSTRRSKMALAWSLLDPGGEVLAASREVNRHKGFRFIRFEPTTPGRYTVNVERLRGALAGGTIDVDRRGVDVNPHRREAAVVRVTVNDRRVVMPWISWLSKRML